MSTYEEFLTKMSYLFPIATNFVNNKSISVPINEQSTIASLNKLFSKDNINNDERFGYNLWCSSSQKFVSKFMYNYWSDDPLMESNIDIHTLQPLSVPVRQYIALSLINLNNRNNKNGHIYNIETIQFNNLDELIELFTYMSNLQFTDYTQTIINVLGETTISGVSSRLNGDIEEERNAEYAKKDEEDKLKRELEQQNFEQQLAEAGLSKPTMTYQNIATNLMSLTKQFNEIYLRELKIRRDFAKNENDLKQSYQSRVSEDGVLQTYFTEHNNLIADRKNQINEVYSNLTHLQTTLENLKRESACRDSYDALVWGNVKSTLAQSLSDLQNGFDLTTLVLVDDQPVTNESVANESV